MPGETLPYVDEHAVAIAANPDAAWSALLQVVDRATASTAAVRFAGLLGCADVAPGGPRPLSAGSRIAGFHVAAAERPRELALLGNHRFSDYALLFRLEPAGAETRLRAETRADFPGLHGGAYRALVIGTRGHVLAVRRILGAVKRRAEREGGDGGPAGVSGA